MLALGAARRADGQSGAAAPPTSAPPSGDSTEHLPWIEEPERRLAILDGELHAGRFGAAAASARAEVDLGLGGGERPSIDLAEALSRLALAEAGLGRSEDAVWHWHEALNLTPGALSPGELAGFGAAGALLAAHPLRRPGAAPAGIALGSPAAPAAGIGPPRLLSGALPSPEVLRRGHSGIPPSLRIEIAVDAEGRVREPVLVAGRGDDVAVRALESLRAFRFAPASVGGRPVAMLQELLVDPPAGRPLAAMLPASSPTGPSAVDLAAVEALLRAGRSAEAGRLAEKRWSEALHGAARSPDLLGTALALRALAAASAAPAKEPGTFSKEPGTFQSTSQTPPKEPGTPPKEPGTSPGTLPSPLKEPGTFPKEPGTLSGSRAAAICRWQAAEVLSPALYDADLAPYGAAGELLGRNRWGSERWVVHGGGDRSREGKSGAAAAPPRPRVLEHARPAYPRFLREERLQDAVVVSGVVDAEGVLRQPELRSPGASPNLDAAALDALCGFRFQPAVAGGVPVASFYSVTIEFSPD